MSPDADAAFDLITMGRVSVDLYPQQSGVPLAEVRTFAKSLGGSPTNVAVAAARLGRRSAVITRVGDDGFGPYVREALRQFGVDACFVGTDPQLRTPIVFCELLPPEDPPLLFYRQPKAPDMNLRFSDLDEAAIRRAPIFWTTDTGLSGQPSRGATLRAMASRSADQITVHDLDYRPMLWSSEAEARRWARTALEHATVAVGNRTEAALAVGDGTPEELAERLLAMGLEMAIVKLGADGVLVATTAGMVRTAALRVPVVCGLGASDAFGGALVHGLLAGWDPRRMMRFASAAGALVAGQLACADAMPDEAAVEALLASAS